MWILLHFQKLNWIPLFLFHSLNLLRGYYLSFRPDTTKQGSGLFVYIKSSIPSRQPSYGSICDFIPDAPFEINLRQEKWLEISIYLPLSQDIFF